MQEGTPVNYVARVLKNSDSMGTMDEDCQVHIAYVEDFIRRHMAIFRVYAPFLILPDRNFTGPMVKDITYATTARKEQKGRWYYSRNLTGTPSEIWDSVTQVSGFYFWPKGENIRDWLISTVRAVKVFDMDTANKNRQVLYGTGI